MLSFQDPVNDEAYAQIVEKLGEPIASDRKTFLFDLTSILSDNIDVLNQIANTAKQPATVEILRDGDVKTMSDGTQYRVTRQGWKRLPMIDTNVKHEQE